MEAGRSFAELQIACLVTVVPAPNVDAAVDRSFGALGLSGLTPESVRAYYLLGDDDSLLERVAAYRAAGVEHLRRPRWQPGDDLHAERRPARWSSVGAVELSDRKIRPHTTVDQHVFSPGPVLQPDRLDEERDRERQRPQRRRPIVRLDPGAPGRRSPMQRGPVGRRAHTTTFASAQVTPSESAVVSPPTAETRVERPDRAASTTSDTSRR